MDVADRAGDRGVMFKREHGDWTRYRTLPLVREFDFHHEGPPTVPFEEAMQRAEDAALAALQAAQNDGISFVLFRHGNSTSRPGRMTIRSVVRSAMRKREATPYIVRPKCIQHDSVFVAAIRVKGRQA